MKKTTLFILIMALLLGSVLYGCVGNDPVNPIDPIVPPSPDNPVDSPDEVTPYDAALTVDLSELSADITANSPVEIQGSSETLTITEAGDYVLSGNFSQGVVISAGDKETVHLFLENASITNENGIAVSNTNKKSSLVITAVSGSVNSVSGSGDGTNAVHVKGNLMLNGSGSLSVAGNSKNAIKVSKTLSITDINLTLSSANHAVSARNIEIENASVTVTSAAKDGLNAECDDDVTAFPDELQGYVYLKNSVYSATVSGDGIQADTVVVIDGGKTDITTEGSFIPYSEANKTLYGLEDDDFRYIKSGNSYKKVASDYFGRSASLYALVQSCKGIKVGEISYEDADGNEIDVTEGEYVLVIDNDAIITINSSDDALHVNCGDAVVKSGTLTLSSPDDGITADRLALISGGSVTITDSYEGIEGGYVKISGGTITVTSSDDGINAASDDDSVKEYIIISGGDITVNAGGDGIDSNGSVLISGGTLVIHGPVSGADSSLDSETGILVTGGTLFATSSMGMLETPSTSSAQCVLFLNATSSLSAGSTITVRDSEGSVIIQITLVKSAQTFIISSPDFVLNGTYTISSGSSVLATVTLTSTVTTSGRSGGNGGNPGGGRPGR